MWFHAMGSRMDLSPAQPKIELPDGPGRARQCRFCDPESSAECLYVPYKRVLSERLSGNINAVHADKRGIVPVVMTHQEVAAVLSLMNGTIQLVAKLLGVQEMRGTGLQKSQASHGAGRVEYGFFMMSCH
jgi:hypothetical protein